MLTASRRDQRELFFDKGNEWYDLDHREGHGGGQPRLAQLERAGLSAEM